MAGSNCEWQKSVRIDRPYLPEHNVQVNRVAFYLPEKRGGNYLKLVQLGQGLYGVGQEGATLILKLKKKAPNGVDSFSIAWP